VEGACSGGELSDCGRLSSSCNSKLGELIRPKSSNVSVVADVLCVDVTRSKVVMPRKCRRGKDAGTRDVNHAANADKQSPSCWFFKYNSVIELEARWNMAVFSSI